LKITSPSAPAASSLPARFEKEEKNGESLTATGIETAPLTAAAVWSVRDSTSSPFSSGSVAR
jgi:hypothetical protein